MSELPSSWVSTTVGNVFDVVGGGTPSTSVADFWAGDIPWISSADISEDGTASPRRFITQEAVDKSAASVVPEGSVIVVTRVGLGKVALAHAAISFSQDSQALLPRAGIHSEFLRLQLSQVARQLKHISRGTTIAGVTKKQLLDLPLALAPTSEQQRIVAAIEEQFSRLDAGVAALQRVRQNLRRYRVAVLKAAVSGELTKIWRDQEQDSNLPRSRSEADGVIAGKGAISHDLPVLPTVEQAPSESVRRRFPHGWRWTTLGSICECLDSRRVPVNKEERISRQGSIPYYGANGQVGWIDDYLFDESLVLLVEDETFTGREKPFSYKITGKSWVNNHAHVLRPKPGINLDYLNYLLAYYPFTPLTTGTTGRKKLTKSAMLAAPLALPSEAEQQHIVAEVDHRLSIMGHLEAQVESSLRHASAIRQSVLNQAFSGKLVPQDPTDEPASLLLERIAAQRAAPSAPRPTRKSRQLRLPA